MPLGLVGRWGTYGALDLECRRLLPISLGAIVMVLVRATVCVWHRVRPKHVYPLYRSPHQHDHSSRMHDHNHPAAGLQQLLPVFLVGSHLGISIFSVRLLLYLFGACL
jgi:hypothetical protein